MKTKLYPGDLVEVKAPEEILQTLDGDGTLDRLPFMPEMIEFCGKRFQVAKRVVKTCYYGKGSGMREFRDDDVVLLDGLRCSGAAHDDCQKACMIFWREAWLHKVEDASVPSNARPEGSQQLRARLKTSTGPATYFCQASEILNATKPLSKLGRFLKCVSDVRAGNSSAVHMAKQMGVWVYWKTRKLLLGEYASGSQKTTPQERLALQPGELVEVKSIAGIVETLNEKAYNRGLYFGPGMGIMCGEQRRVERRIEKIIVDGTGEMRQVHNTVYLEDSPCECAYVAFGGCPRGEFAYWREIWLRRREKTRVS